MPLSFTALMTQSIIGANRTSARAFGFLLFIRVPSPAARITAHFLSIKLIVLSLLIPVRYLKIYYDRKRVKLQAIVHMTARFFKDFIK